MFRMFLNATKFKRIDSFLKWDVEEVTNMQEMFLNATHFNDDIGSTWLGSAATNEQNDIFLGADAFNKVYECNTDVDGPVSSSPSKQEAPMRRAVTINDLVRPSFFTTTNTTTNTTRDRRRQRQRQ